MLLEIKNQITHKISVIYNNTNILPKILNNLRNYGTNRVNTSLTDVILFFKFTFNKLSGKYFISDVNDNKGSYDRAHQSQHRN